MAAPILEIINYEGRQKGPVLLVLGGVHGNEPGPPRAVRAVESLIENGGMEITAGELIMLPEVNRQALKNGTRCVDRDLNRRIKPYPNPKTHEDYICNELCPFLEQADILLDLHAYEAGSRPFIYLGPPHEDEYDFAFALGAEHYCWNFAAAVSAAQDPEESIGTTEYCRAHGGYGVTLECGQKRDIARTMEFARDAIIRALEHLGMVRQGAAANLSPLSGRRHFVKIVKSIVRPGPGGDFVQDWGHLDPVGKGDLLAKTEDGVEIFSDIDGYIVMPHRSADPGTNWLYLGIEQDPRDHSVFQNPDR